MYLECYALGSMFWNIGQVKRNRLLNNEKLASVTGLKTNKWILMARLMPVIFSIT